MPKQPIEITITQNGIYDINLPYGCLVLRVEGDTVEIEQVGHQQIVLTKENVLATADEDELFALFHTFIHNLKVLNPGKYDKVTVLDQEIGKVVNQMKYRYKEVWASNFQWINHITASDEDYAMSSLPLSSPG